MKKQFKIILLVILLIVVFIVGFIIIKKNNEKKYNSEEIIGMTRSSIIDEYGAFDKVFYEILVTRLRWDGILLKNESRQLQA